MSKIFKSSKEKVTVNVELTINGKLTNKEVKLNKVEILTAASVVGDNKIKEGLDSFLINGLGLSDKGKYDYDEALELMSEISKYIIEETPIL